MKTIILNWTEKYLSNVEALVLILWLVAVSSIIFGLGHIFAPVFASIVVAYLLQGLVKSLRPYLGARAAVLLVYLLFMSLFFSALFFFIPILGEQLGNLFEAIPSMIGQIEKLLNSLPPEYQLYVSHGQVNVLIGSLAGDMRSLGHAALTVSIASIPTLMGVLLYLVLVPVMVFFFLKDHQTMTRWFFRFLPDRRPALSKIWSEIDQQLGNYIRGKCVEAILVGVVTYVGFMIFHLQYAALLACFVALSVCIPLVGMILVTVPVLIVALFQWGLTPEFAWAMGVYGVIQLLDGNVVVPLLFSEAVSLHPVTIILALLCFGGLWGFWGMFFAIPLAVFCKAILDGWPKN